MKVTSFFSFIFLFLISCVSRPDNYELLQGEWRNVSLHLIQHSVDNTSSDSVLIVKAEDWDSILEMRPIRTTFSSNGTFVSRYYNLSDSLVFESSGNWYFIGDSLYLSSDEGLNTYLFQVLEDNQARFVSKLDWDSDGHPDDEYDGIQQKQRN